MYFFSVTTAAKINLAQNFFYERGQNYFVFEVNDYDDEKDN